MIAIRLLSIAAAATAFSAMTACSDSTTGVGTTSEVSAATVADNPSSTSNPSTGGTNPSTYQGTLTGTAQVQISTDGHAWVAVGQPRDVSVALASTANVTTLSAGASVPVGAYAYVRLVFSSGAQASVSGQVGGTSANGTVVSLGSGQVVIQKQIQPVTLRAGTNARVVWDLNSELWLTPAAMQSRTAAATAVQAAAWAAILTD